MLRMIRPTPRIGETGGSSGCMASRTPASSATGTTRRRKYSSVSHSCSSPIGEEQLWETLEYFLRRVVPVAEEAGVRLAMHPDDPPVSPIRGVGRIMRSIDNYQRLLDLVPSPMNGITLCQGNFSLMTPALPAAIR